MSNPNGRSVQARLDPQWTSSFSFNDDTKSAMRLEYLLVSERKLETWGGGVKEAAWGFISDNDSDNLKMQNITINLTALEGYSFKEQWHNTFVCSPQMIWFVSWISIWNFSISVAATSCFQYTHHTIKVLTFHENGFPVLTRKLQTGFFFWRGSYTWSN